jgi:hypothetical protein
VRLHEPDGHALATIPTLWKHPFSATSYSNVGDNRNGVPGTTSACPNHPSQSPGSTNILPSLSRSS